MVAAMVLCTLLLSCSGRPRIIPRSTLTDIYADMFLADQWLKDNNSFKKGMDTTLFYDPIFARYGYTFADYDATVKQYMRDPEKFSKVFRDAAEKLKKEGARYGKMADRIKENRRFNELFRNYSPIDFDADSLLWSRDSVTVDTVAVDSLVLDSLRRDSLRIDSLARVAFVADSLQRDSLRRDSIRLSRARRDSLRRESLKRAPAPKKPGKNKITRMTND